MFINRPVTGTTAWQNTLPEHDKKVIFTNQENPKLHWLFCCWEMWHQQEATTLGGIYKESFNYVA